MAVDLSFASSVFEDHLAKTPSRIRLDLAYSVISRIFGLERLLVGPWQP
jgi:hypothetical protein